MTDGPFYSEGLRFSCVRCSTCCRIESGFVYLSENDLSRLAKDRGMDYTAFVETWCRWVPLDRDRERLSLREKDNFDCVFWKDGCTVYSARPLQCRAFPFWDSVVCSGQAWKTAGKDCPGIDKGEYFEMEKIDGFINLMADEPVIERKRAEIPLPRLGEF